MRKKLSGCWLGVYGLLRTLDTTTLLFARTCYAIFEHIPCDILFSASLGCLFSPGVLYVYTI
jgi:hypothetical protein